MADLVGIYICSDDNTVKVKNMELNESFEALIDIVVYKIKMCKDSYGALRIVHKEKANLVASSDSFSSGFEEVRGVVECEDEEISSSNQEEQIREKDKTGNMFEDEVKEDSHLVSWKHKKVIDGYFDTALGDAKATISENLFGGGTPSAQDSEDSRVSCSLNTFFK